MFFLDVTDEEWDALPRKVQARLRRLYANALTQDALLAALKGLVADWERVHGPMPSGHEAVAAIAQAEGGTKP
jgi:hypothetical protein